MSAAHTPGPWDFGPGYEPGKSTFDLYGPGGRQVIASASYENMWLATYDLNTDAANVRLIASAPDLLEAAILAEDIIDDFLGHLSPDEQVACKEDPKASAALKALRAAIAKATGQ